MFSVCKREIEWGGRTLTLETGKIARQADGAVMVSYGDTMVLCTAVARKSANPDQDFFPLTVNYQEKFYAGGRIPGGFFKRETRPSEKETLTSRLIDRPIRPLFHSEFKNETQVICTVMSYDGVNNPDIPALIGASAALTLSGIPFMGPIAGARVGYIDGDYVLNPTPEQLEETKLDLIVAATRDSVMMVESEADQLPEDVMLGSVMYGQKAMQPVIDAIISMAEEAAKEPWDISDNPLKAELLPKVEEMAGDALKKAFDIKEKQARSTAIAEAKAPVMEKLVEEEGHPKLVVADLLKGLESKIVRTMALKDGVRIDGRGMADIRPIETELDILPRTHASALFTRGETQSIVVATLGNARDQQLVETLDGEGKDHIMLHYNFPPYSVGEAGMLRGPGRREIGHGNLARRSIKAVLPEFDEFPYTIRLVSEITESNGSSSMATVCGSSLALMSGGVPIKAGVSGIAMGLILEDDGFAVLSDIMGDEDHLGDMDFKVAGTKDGVTALQMDIKVAGITEEIMKQALSQANEGRAHILAEMEKSIKEPREELNEFAPKMIAITIDKDKIRDVIGPGGKVITEICEETGAKIDIEQDGTVRVSGDGDACVKEAIRRIEAIVFEPQLGEIYDGVVDGVVDFGAFVKIGGKSGLVHISELDSEHVEKVTDFVNEGDAVKIKVVGIDPKGKLKLSYKAVNQETGEDLFPDDEPVDMRKQGRGPKKGGRGKKPQANDDAKSNDDASGEEGGERRRRRPF